MEIIGLDNCDLILFNGKFYLRQSDGMFVSLHLGAAVPKGLQLTLEESYIKTRKEVKTLSTVTQNVCDFCEASVGILQKIEVSFAVEGEDVETLTPDPKDMCLKCKERLIAFLENGCRQPRKRSEKKEK